MTLDELRRTAESRGITTHFSDAAGRDYDVSEATLAAVLEAMGPAPVAAAAWPPVVVARPGRPPGWRPPRGEPATLVLGDGRERPLPDELPGDLPHGWHRVAGRSGATTLVVAPGRCHLPPLLAGGGRAWGWAAQLYAVRSRASWGIGDLGDLAGLLESTAPLGAGFALLNPLHAASPGEPSPYNPSSRVFRNPLYLRIEAVPELAALAAGERDRVETLARAGRELGGRDRIDRPAVYRLKDTALRLVHGALARLPGRRAGLAAYRAGTAGLERYATFCALQHVHGHDWRAWPAAYRHPGRPEVAEFGDRHGDEVSYHAWLQWLLDQQLAAVVPGPDRLGVLNDLAIGFAPDGFDAWSFQDELAAGITVGAPPDPLGPHGQDWGLPAFVPDRLAAGGYGPFAQTIRAGMAHAAGLRIDHVMGLFRLFWIPDGAEPAEGTYVRYPADDLLGVLALESEAAGALVVGEDLGTVEPGVRERLAAEGVLSYRLAWFEQGPDGGRRLPPAGPGRHHHPRPADRGRLLQRQRPGASLRHRGGHPRRGRAGRPGGPAGQPLPAAGGRGPAGAGRALGGGDRGRPLRLPRPHPVDAAGRNPGGRGRGARPAQRARHHRPAAQLGPAPARPARRPGRRPPGPAARGDPLGGGERAAIRS